jgi:arylsulfatase A-like enzyme
MNAARRSLAATAAVAVAALATAAAAPLLSPRRPTQAAGAAHGPAGTAASSAKQNVLLVTLDTTRADRLGSYGYANARTPFLDRLAREGTRFTQAYCAAPITLPSHATILTGADPVAHGVHENGLFRLAEERTTLAEALRAEGWQTAAFVGSFVLDARFGLAQGFATYEGPGASELGLQAEMIERPAAAVVDGAIRWLARARADRPVFLWIHFYDPHAPYLPPESQRLPGTNPYDGEIAECDAQLLRLHEELVKRGRMASLLEVVTADHGEAFGAHGELTHGLLLHDATMRVPLLVRGAGVPAGAVMPTAVGNGAIAATVLEQLGLSKDLLPEAHHAPLPFAMEEGGEPRDPLLLETHLPYYEHAWSPLHALVQDGLKLVSGRFDQLFDLATDPSESTDVAAERPDVALALRRRLDTTLQERRTAVTTRNELSAEELARLSAVGYVLAGAAGDPLADRGERPDPRDAVKDEREQQAAMAEFRQARELLGQDQALVGTDVDVPLRRQKQGQKLLESALNRLLQLEARHPEDPSLAFDLGNVLLSLRRFPEAAPRFERAVLAEPREPIRHYNLAVAYARSGKGDYAIAEMEKAAWLEPRLLLAYRFIVDAYERKGDDPRAMFWIKLLADVDVLPDQEKRGFLQKRFELQRRLDQKGQRPQPPVFWPPPDLRPERLAVEETGQ